MTEEDSREIDEVFENSILAWTLERDPVANTYDYGHIIRSGTKKGVIITPSWYHAREGPNGEQWSVVAWIMDKSNSSSILDTLSLTSLPPFQDGFTKTSPEDMVLNNKFY